MCQKKDLATQVQRIKEGSGDRGTFELGIPGSSRRGSWVFLRIGVPKMYFACPFDFRIETTMCGGGCVIFHSDAQWPWEKRPCLVGWLGLKGNPSKKRERKKGASEQLTYSLQQLASGLPLETRNKKCLVAPKFQVAWQKLPLGFSSRASSSARIGCCVSSSQRLGSSSSCEPTKTRGS